MRWAGILAPGWGNRERKVIGQWKGGAEAPPEVVLLLLLLFRLLVLLSPKRRPGRSPHTHPQSGANSERITLVADVVLIDDPAMRFAASQAVLLFRMCPGKPRRPFCSKMISLLRLRLFIVVMQESLRVVLVMEFLGFCCCCA